MLLECLNTMPGFTSHRYSDYPMLWTPYWWNRLLGKLPDTRVASVERAHRDRIYVTRNSPEAFEEPLWRRFFPPAPPAACDVIDADTHRPAFERFFREHMAKLVCARGARRYVSKGNYNTLRIGYLARLFPDARFIVPMRQPLAQVASLLKQDRLYAGAPVRTLRHIAARGHDEFGPQQRLIRVDAEQFESAAATRDRGRLAEAWMMQWLAAYGHVERLCDAPEVRRRLHVVSYERLCAEPESTLLHLLDAVDIDADDRAWAEDLVRRDWAGRFVAATGDPQDTDAIDAVLLARAQAMYARLSRVCIAS